MSIGFWLCLFIMVQIVQNMGYRAGIKQHGLSGNGYLENLMICHIALWVISLKMFGDVANVQIVFMSWNHIVVTSVVLFNILPFKEFSWAILVIVLLHFKMNASRSFRKTSLENIHHDFHGIWFRIPDTQGTRIPT